MEQQFSSYRDFLRNKDFIQWRLTRLPESDKYWLSFIDNHPELREEFEKAILWSKSIRINEKNFTDVDLLYRQILLKIAKKKQRRKRLVFYISSAAAIAAFILSGIFYTIQKDSSHHLQVAEEIVGNTLPNQNILLVVDGKTISLHQDTKVEIADGQMLYSDSTDVKKSINIDGQVAQLNKLIVPYGKRSSLVLADGSKVWVNSGTELEFPSAFNGSTREISVSGEIFIDVSTSKNRPFIVHTSGLDVKVYGTSFNICAYESDDEESVVLVNGSVEVSTKGNKSTMMSPNEIVRFEGNKLTKKKVDTSFYTSWVDGVFVFERTPISEIFVKIGRHYNVAFEKTTDTKTITGKLYLSENLDDVIASISLLTGKEYKRIGNTIVLINK